MYFIKKLSQGGGKIELSKTIGKRIIEGQQERDGEKIKGGYPRINKKISQARKP